MGLVKVHPLEESTEDQLSDEALALIEHIGQILAKEYVQLLKLEEPKLEKEE